MNTTKTLSRKDGSSVSREQLDQLAKAGIKVVNDVDPKKIAVRGDPQAISKFTARTGGWDVGVVGRFLARKGSKPK